ncbi:MAG: hypothetical protein U0573_01140 [Phycisphaerales bacterium]|nr:hypothetical protein [Planctomycetota bacterium]
MSRAGRTKAKAILCVAAWTIAAACLASYPISWMFYAVLTRFKTVGSDTFVLGPGILAYSRSSSGSYGKSVWVWHAGVKDDWR